MGGLICAKIWKCIARYLHIFSCTIKHVEMILGEKLVERVCCIQRVSG